MLSWSSRSVGHRSGSSWVDPLQLSLTTATTDPNVILSPVDLTPVYKLKDKVQPYCDSDIWLKELHAKIEEFIKLVCIYNDHYAGDCFNAIDDSLARAANRNFSNAFSDSVAQGSLHIPGTTLNEIEKHADVMIASKILDPLWQIDKHGYVTGILRLFKSLFMPKDYYTHVSALFSCFGAMKLYFRLESLSGAGSQMTISQTDSTSPLSTMKKFSNVLAVCGVGTIFAVSALQFYNASLSRKDSEIQLSLWVEQLQIKNNCLYSRFRDCHVDNRFDRMDQCMYIVEERSATRDQETQQMISSGNSMLNNKIDENTNTVREIYDSFSDMKLAMASKVNDLQNELGAINQSQKDLNTRLFNFQSFGRQSFASLQAKQKLIARSLRLLDSRNDGFKAKIHASINEGLEAISRLERGQSKIQIAIEDTNSKITLMMTFVQEGNSSGGNLLRSNSSDLRSPLRIAGGSSSSPIASLVRHGSASSRTNNPLLEELE